MKKIEKFGTVRYYNENNQLHRIDGPAIEYANGDKEWWINGKLHRTDGPTCEYVSGYKAWYINSKRHRENAPAVEHSDGSKEWWVNNKRHREDGPAVEHHNGKEWFINGEQLTEQEFNLSQYQSTNDFSEGF